MKIKRVVSLLLAFAVLLGGIPFIGLNALKVEAAGDYDSDTKNKIFTINTEAGWEYFAKNCQRGVPGGDRNFTNWTVNLADNISITTPLIPSADDFAGTFNGQNHSITLPAGDSYFAKTDTKPLGDDVGLFHNIILNGKLENLIVRLNKGSTLYVSETLKNCNVSTNVINFGVLVGRMSNTAKMTNCALVGGGSVLYRNNIGYMETAYMSKYIAVGSMVGMVEDQAAAEGCYSDVNAKAWSASFNNAGGNGIASMLVGGLFGVISSKATTKNCISINQQIEACNAGAAEGVNSQYTGAGGITASAYSLENMYVKGSAVSLRMPNIINVLNVATTEELPCDMGWGTAAAIAQSKGTMLNCFGNTTFSLQTNRSIILNDGYVGNINTITAERMGAEWANTNQKCPNLKWLVNEAPTTSAIDASDTAAIKDGSLTMDPNYAELNKVAGYQPAADALWSFTMTAPIKGRIEPFTGDVKAGVTYDVGSTTTIKEKTITMTAVSGTKLYYKLATAMDGAVYTNVKQLENVGGYKEYYGMVTITDVAELKNPMLLVVAAPTDGSAMLLSTTSQYDLAVQAGDTSAVLKVQNRPVAGYAPTTIDTGTMYYTSDTTDKGALIDSGTPLTLKTILTKKNVVYQENTVDYIAAGRISVNIFAAKDRFDENGENSRFVAAKTLSSVKGNISPRPTIFPRGTGIISNGVTINVPTGTKVFYTWTEDPRPGAQPVHPELDATGNPVDATITKEYTANTVLPFPDQTTKLVVRAIAYEKGKTVSDEDYVEYSNDSNLPQPYAPRLLVAGADHSDASTYPDSSEIKFTHASLAEGLIYFTVNSSVPSASNANAYRYGKGQTYDETKPFTLPTISGRDFIEVKAVFHSNKTLLDSPVGTYRVHTKQVLKAPAASIPTGKRVPPGEVLLLSLSDTAIAQLNSIGKISAARIKYNDGKDGSVDTDKGLMLIGTDKPINGTEYISYNVDQSNEAYSLPIIRYKLGAGATDIDKSGTLCQYGQRRVLTKTESGITTATVTYINPVPIILTGEADKTITVNAVALSELEAYSNSAVASFEYTIFKAAAKPLAIPATSDTSFTMLAPGSFISLASSTVNTSIYYTVNNSIPVPQDYIAWVKNGSIPANKPATMLYDDAVGITMPDRANTLFTVRAVAHSNDNSFVDSEAAQFTYQPPSQVNTVYVSPSQGSVLAGTQVQLKCGTADAHIFYKLHTTAPDLTDPTVVPKPYKDQLFDTLVPIAINKETWITAVAEKDGVTSAMTSYHYTLYSKTAIPSAIPATTPEAVATLSPGTVINLSTITANADIYYTTDNSHPSPQDYIAWVGSGSPAANKPATMLYKTQDGITMPNVTTFFTVRAVAHSNDVGSEDSPEAQFTYKSPSQVNTVYVSPSQGSVLAGTQVQLKCGTADANIFYKLHTTAPDLTDPTVVPKPYKDQLFDTLVPIVINKETWITAVAEKDGVTSAMTSYHYTLYSKTAIPSAIPATTPEAAATLSPGTVINLSTITANADIYYTTDNSHPSPQDYITWVKNGSKPETKPATMLYKTQDGITMPNIMTFFTVRAVAHSNDVGSEDSPEAQFTYKSPSQVNTVYVSPSQGSVVTGTQVQLKCGTADANIFYKLHTTAPDLTDPTVVPKPYKDQLFDTLVPIVINKETWITAVAEKDGVTSAMTSYHYTLYSKTAIPSAIPATTPEAVATLSPGTVINLSTITANADIYYTIDNSHPSPQDYITWVKNGSKPETKPATMLYKTQNGITMPNVTTFFTIRAVAHSDETGSEDSLEAQFTYQMPAQVNSVYVSPSQGSVVTGTQVQLKCSTADAKIFYRIFASKPADITAPENIPKPYKDQLFDAASPLVITKNIWIVALAEKSGMVSAPTMYEYTVAPLTAEPTASLKTGSVVNRGTRIRLSGAGNIAFTMDGSDPKAAVAAMQTPSGGAKASEAPAKAAEVFFGDSFVVDAEFGKSVTVRAFTYGDGKTPSNVVSFTYTVCEKDSYITAVPQSGSVVTSADQITLATTISDGKIFYSTGIDTPVLVNRYADAAIDAAENEPYTHYQWIAGANTIQGTSLKISGAAGSTVTIKAVACANGSEGGATQVFTYKIRDKTAAPTASIPNGAVTLEGATVVLSAREGDIFFTTDGTKPSTSSRLYTEPIEVPGSMVLKAIAVAKDKTESDVVEYHYSYADQAFAPEMSIPSGEIEQGKLLTLTSKTENASIYYTTNGAEPTEKSTLYTAPINIMRPVTIKAIAIYTGLRNSAVNSASYTVIEPPPPQTENGADGKPQGPLNSLVSRRTYFDETVGPKFSAFVARDNATNTVISANDGIVPQGAKLVVKRIDTSDSDREAVRTALGNEVVVLYDVSLEKDGEKVEPSGEVELGITIPEEYQNSLVTVCRIGADNTVEEYEPRRSGTAAYFLVSGKLDRYAVTIPEELAASGGKLSATSIVLLVIAAIVALSMCAGAVTFLIIRRRSRITESDLPLEQEENFEDFFSDELHDGAESPQPTQNEDENNS